MCENILLKFIVVTYFPLNTSGNKSFPYFYVNPVFRIRNVVDINSSPCLMQTGSEIKGI